MSGTFLVNFSESNLKYDELNVFANEMILFALRKNLGVRFIDSEYFPELVQERNMKHYFFLSDSFLHCNANFLDMCDLAYVNQKNLKKAFCKKYSFVEELVTIIKNHKISKVDIYISDDGSVQEENDFEILQSQEKDLLNQLYNACFQGKGLNVFPTIKVILSLDVSLH